MFFFQMPWLPELMLRMSDFFMLEQVFADLRGKKGEEVLLSDEEIEAFKYTFSQQGIVKLHLDVDIDAIYFNTCN